MEKSSLVTIACSKHINISGAVTSGERLALISENSTPRRFWRVRKRTERIGGRDARGADIAARQAQAPPRSLSGSQTFDRHINAARGQPFQIARGVSGGAAFGGTRQPSPDFRELLHRRARRLVEIEQRLAIVRHERVEIDQLRNAVARAIGDAGRDHAAIAMADQHDVAQVLIFDDVEDVLIWVSRSIEGLARCARSPRPG